jgi:ATP-dependent RNA helicase RhlE
VINFDVPNTPEAYTHRIGRTGRSGNEGKAFTFITTDDRDWIRATERMIGSTIAQQSVDGFELGPGGGTAGRGGNGHGGNGHGSSGRSNNGRGQRSGRKPGNSGRNSRSSSTRGRSGGRNGSSSGRPRPAATR